MNMESDVKFSWTLLKKEFKPILIGMGFFLILLFFEKASFALSVISSILFFFLFVISIFDIKYLLIFDKFLLYFLSAFLIIYFLENSFFPSILEGFLTALISATFFILMQIIIKNGVGGGDIKLMFCLSFWLGFEKILLAFYIAIISVLFLAIFYKKFRTKDAKIPFGAFLSFGAIISFLYGEKILGWYGEFFL